MVRLPDGPDRMIDHRSGTTPAVGSSGDEVPEPRTEVGAAEDRVREHADEQHDRRGGAHGSRSPVVDAVVARGP